MVSRYCQTLVKLTEFITIIVSCEWKLLGMLAQSLDQLSQIILSCISPAAAAVCVCVCVCSRAHAEFLPQVALLHSA
jgi:hypothetical protein